MNRLLLILAAAVGAFLVPFYFSEFMQLVSVFSLSNNLHLSFLVAFAAGTVFCFLFVGNGSFAAIFEHELTHMLWAILFFKKPLGLKVMRDQGGYAIYSGGNFLITLAPYFSLTFNLILTPLYYIINHSLDPYFFAIYGLALGFHTATTLKETSPRQPDLRQHGMLASYVFIAFGNLISYGLVLAFVLGRGRGMLDFAQAGVQNAWLFFLNLIG